MRQSDTNTSTDLRVAAASIGARVEQAMRSDLAIALNGRDPLLHEVLDYSLFNGGKRIRPLLVILSSQCCSRDDSGLSRLAAAFEYLHVATLIHDDVIDNASQRRGRATVFSKFGLSAAILAGDWLHARSMHLVGALAGADGLEVFCHATASMVNGEFLQLRLSNEANTEEEPYFTVIRQKTGNLIASACTLGAIYAGATDRLREALATYGQKVGAAFQVVDDLLDYLGDAKTTGKAVGNDFVEGKITLPLLRAIAQADQTDHQLFNGLLSGDRTRSGACEELAALIQKYNGFESALHTARQLVDEAVAALSFFASHEAGELQVTLLTNLARYILSRNK